MTVSGRIPASSSASAALEGASFPTVFISPSGGTFYQPALQVAWDGSVTRLVRVPNVFKNVGTAATGDTAAWTPAAGKKFRLMRALVEVTGNASTAGGSVIAFQLTDGAGGTTIVRVDLWVPAASAGVEGGFMTPWIDLGNGFLSAAANNVLQLNLNAALATGNARVIVIGTEE